MAVGECSWWLEGRRWGIPSSLGPPLKDSAPLHPAQALLLLAPTTPQALCERVEPLGESLVVSAER